MTFWELAVISFGCVFVQQPVTSCLPAVLEPTGHVAAAQAASPTRSGPALDVELTAKAALAWDVSSGQILYDKNAASQRPVASLSKLLTVLTVRDLLSPDSLIEIPPQVRTVQRQGADINLPVGQHASVRDLLAASLIASANDAAVSLAITAKDSEEEFVDYANKYAAQHGFFHTKLVNATGLAGGDQHSTAYDVKLLLTAVYRDSLLRASLSQKQGELVTSEGTKRTYKTTNRLLGTYLPILAAKTGYTIEAGENLAILTENVQGRRIGIVMLGSADRFQDTKILVEWIWRNYTWQ